METEDIRIKYSIIHILDSNNIVPVLSDSLLDLTNEAIREYIKKHIVKCFTSEDNKTCRFIDEHNLNSGSNTYCDMDGDADGDSNTYGSNRNNPFISGIKSIVSEESFIAASRDFSGILFELMKEYTEIPAADVIFCIFQIEKTTYFGILKMNYKTSFIHYVETTDSLISATIMPQYLALPSESQRVDESVFINCEDYKLLLQEKKVNIRDEKVFYLSELYLNCSVKVSDKSKLNTVTKIADNINKKYYDSDVDKKIEFKKALIEEYEEKGEIEPIAVIDKVYKNNLEVKNEFVSQLEHHKIKDEHIVPAERTITKKTERQIFKTDTGIEINIPVEAYSDSRLLEFITNPDGTISIVIKNIATLTSK